MIPIDSPNTFVSIPGSRLFYAFRYKQDDLDSWDGYEALMHRFQDYRDSTFDFQHSINDYPYMR